MSAFLVSSGHLAVLAKFAVRWRGANVPRGLWHEGCYLTDPLALASIWAAENWKSVVHRYPDWREPGAVTVTEADLKSAPDLLPVQVLKAANCLAYQSCEHDGWDTSMAKTLLEGLKAEAVKALPGYEEAEWHYPEQE